MIKKFISQYHIRYPRSLVYMLQASEYDIRDYLIWYVKVKDFAQVEKRKHLVKTAKSQLILVLSYSGLILGYSLALLCFLRASQPLSFLISGGILLLTPLILAYLTAFAAVILKIIQQPVEKRIIHQAKKQLDAHPAVKIAIAGSYGKTSMREILKTVLLEGKKVAAPPHSFNTPLGISQFIKGLKGNEEVILFELGEHYPGDVRKLCQLVQPQMGVVTGINEAHLQKFKTLERTVATIFELADWLGDKPLYINGESKLARGKAPSGSILYSRTGTGDWQVQSAHTGLEGTKFKLVKGDQTINSQSKLLGLHQVGPLAVAASIAMELGLSTEEIQSGLKKTKPFDHRLETRTDTSGVVTLDDSYNGNPDGVNAVIEFLASLKANRRIYVTPGLVEMGVKSEEVHRQIGKKLSEAAIEKVILIRNSVTPWIEKGLKQAGYSGEVIWFEDALTAFAALPHITVSGDVVLLQNDWPDQYH